MQNCIHYKSLKNKKVYVKYIFRNIEYFMSKEITLYMTIKYTYNKETFLRIDNFSMILKFA